MRLFVAVTLATTLAASAAFAQNSSSPPPILTDPGSILALQKEKFQPTIDRLNRQDAMMRLRAFSPAEIREVEEQTQRVLVATGTSCDVVEAVRVGQTVRRRDLFEVACANGYGYILMNGATPAAYDCWTLARIGLALRRENPRSNIGTQCGLERNVGDMSDQLLARANTAR